MDGLRFVRSAGVRQVDFGHVSVPASVARRAR